MQGINKQKAGFRFGKHRLRLVTIFGELKHRERTYKLAKVQTQNNGIYYSLRLYNSQGKFIKQLLFEPDLATSIATLLKSSSEKEKID